MPSLMSSVYLISNTVLHLLPNMLENKQSILLQDTDFSDDVCFICRRGGTIACCNYANCVKVQLFKTRALYFAQYASSQLI